MYTVAAILASWLIVIVLATAAGLIVGNAWVMLGGR